MTTSSDLPASGLPASVEALVRVALAEDLGAAGDVTASAIVPEDEQASGALVARRAGVVAGLSWVVAVFAAVDQRVQLELIAEDGRSVQPGTVLARVHGPTRSVLAGERTALNLLTHLSGVATLTARYVAEVAGTGAVIRDTRKTLPGLRVLQKAAVLAGGGTNHRMGLSDGLLVKDNHVTAGGVAAATRAALEHAGGLPVQVEVDDLDQLEEALSAGASSVLLDNFGLEPMRAAVERCRAAGGVFVEASGGVNLDTVGDIARTGVDAIAVGALTHSAPVLDIGLDFDPVPTGAPAAAGGGAARGSSAAGS